MEAPGMLPLPVPPGVVVPAALALVAAGIGLLGMTFFILFNGNNEDIAGIRLLAAAATFAGGLLLPTLVVVGMLLTPLAQPSSVAEARPAKEAGAERTKPKSEVKAAPAVAKETASAATPTPKAAAAGEGFKPAAAVPAEKAAASVNAAAQAPAKAPTAGDATADASKAKVAAAGTIKSDPASVARGKTVVVEQNCLACHRIDGKGGAVGPNLSDVASRRDADWLLRHFKDPQSVSPGTLMPKFQLSDADFASLTAYMLTLRAAR